MSSRAHDFMRFPAVRFTSSQVIAALLLAPVCALSQTQKPLASVHGLAPLAAAQYETSKGNNSGTRVTPSGSNEGWIILGTTLAAGLATAAAVHHHEHEWEKSDNLFKNGPKVPDKFSMSHCIIDGIIGPNWPIALDYEIDGVGTVNLDITAVDKTHYHQELTNAPDARDLAIRYPNVFPDKLQSAVFDIEAVAPAGSNAPPPTLRLYGIAVGPKAVGSIGIDRVSFGPSQLKISQEAQYGFRSHSDFSNVRADNMLTGLKENHIVMKQENETLLNPVAQGEHAQGSLQSKGTEGQHMLQIRAWRGNAGDWVVAWSPDVVILTK